MHIGHRIKERREQLGLNQTELAKRMGLTRSAICNVEKRERIQIKKIPLYAKALNCTESYLMGWEDISDEYSDIDTDVLAYIASNPELLKIINKIKQLESDDLTKIEEHIDFLLYKQEKD